MIGEALYIASYLFDPTLSSAHPVPAHLLSFDFLQLGLQFENVREQVEVTPLIPSFKIV
jgi:hypothetical protein